MLEIGEYGSLEDRRFATSDSEERIRERLADAMADEVNRQVKLPQKSGQLLYMT